ncbi:MAG: hypothetical protein KGS72_22755 [Cyanobacteria bacterium REEB67]|nr:hypothetical protein [Cyanobacteria bacterium REEB67]
MNLDDERQHEQSRPIEIEKSEAEARQAHAIVAPPTLFGLGRSAQICLAIFALVLIWGAGSYVFDLSRGRWPALSTQLNKCLQNSNTAASRSIKWAKGRPFSAAVHRV